MVGWSDSACESFGVGDGEGAEGGFPAVDGGAFDEAAGGFALVGWCAGLGCSLSGSFVLDVSDGEPQQFDHGVVVGEVPSVLDDLAELVVERLDLRWSCRSPAALLAGTRGTG